MLATVTGSKPQRAFIATEGAEPSQVIPELVSGLIQSIVSSSASVYTGSAMLVPPELPSMTAYPGRPARLIDRCRATRRRRFSAGSLPPPRPRPSLPSSGDSGVASWRLEAGQHLVVRRPGSVG